MKQVVEALPFVLLLVLVPFFYYNSPNIAQSLIILAIAGLCGYRYYLLDKEKPNYAELFRKELVIIEKEVMKLDQNYGKLTIQDINKKRDEGKFHF